MSVKLKAPLKSKSGKPTRTFHKSVREAAKMTAKYWSTKMQLDEQEKTNKLCEKSLDIMRRERLLLAIPAGLSLLSLVVMALTLLCSLVLGLLKVGAVSIFLKVALIAGVGGTVVLVLTVLAMEWIRSSEVLVLEKYTDGINKVDELKTLLKSIIRQGARGTSKKSKQ